MSIPTIPLVLSPHFRGPGHCACTPAAAFASTCRFHTAVGRPPKVSRAKPATAAVPFVRSSSLWFSSRTPASCQTVPTSFANTRLSLRRRQHAFSDELRVLFRRQRNRKRRQTLANDTHLIVPQVFLQRFSRIFRDRYWRRLRLLLLKLFKSLPPPFGIGKRGWSGRGRRRCRCGWYITTKGNPPQAWRRCRRLRRNRRSIGENEPGRFGSLFQGCFALLRIRLNEFNAVIGFAHPQNK